MRDGEPLLQFRPRDASVSQWDSTGKKNQCVDSNYNTTGVFGTSSLAVETLAGGSQ